MQGNGSPLSWEGAINRKDTPYMVETAATAPQRWACQSPLTHLAPSEGFFVESR